MPIHEHHPRKGPQLLTPIPDLSLHIPHRLRQKDTMQSTLIYENNDLLVQKYENESAMGYISYDKNNLFPQYGFEFNPEEERAIFAEKWAYSILWDPDLMDQPFLTSDYMRVYAPTAGEFNRSGCATVNKVEIPFNKLDEVVELTCETVGHRYSILPYNESSMQLMETVREQIARIPGEEHVLFASIPSQQRKSN